MLSTGRLSLLAVLSASLGAQTAGSLAVSNSALTFLAPSAGDAPAAQHIAITSAITERIDFTVSVEPTSPPWLQLNLVKGTTPARLRVSVDAGSLTKGNFTTRVLIRSASATIPVDINLSVAEVAPSLAVAPAALRFDAAAAVASAEEVLFIRNIGGGGPLPYRVTVLSGGEWLSISPATGVTAPNQPSLVHVHVDPAQAKPADYGMLRVQAGADSIDIPVTALSPPTRPVLGVNLTGLKFEARQGQGNSNNRNILVLNLGDGNLDWTADLLAGREWLSLNMPNGRARRDELGRLGLNATPGDLPAGVYYALIHVAAEGADNSPQYIVPVLNIAPAGAAPALDQTPQGLFFVGGVDQPAPVQPIRVFVSSNEPVPFQASAVTSDGANWLAVDPQSGSSSTAATAQLRVSVNPAILKPGVYSGDVTLAFANREISTTNITLVVPATSATPAAGKQASSRQAEGCVPSRLSLTQTGLVNSFATPAGWPNTLIVRLADDCGDPVLNANVITTFSNGDPPAVMPLTNSVVGLYSATWLPRNAGEGVVVTTLASARGLAGTRTEIIGGVRIAQEAPVLYPGAVLSNFNPEPGAPLAPGSPAQMFGASLTSGSTAAAEALPLPSSLASTSLLIGPNRAPLFFVSPGQMNAQVPPGLTPGKQYAVAILAGGKYSVAEPMAIAAARPALIAWNGSALSRHADSTLVSNESPAQPGEQITIFATGLGATDPAVEAGAAPPADVVARVHLSPRVTIGGREASLREAALLPGTVGVYRIVVLIPVGLSAGDHGVEINQGGSVSNHAPIRLGP